MMTILDVAIETKRTVEMDLLKIPGVTAVDVGYKYIDGKRTNEISIRVHVVKKKKKVNKKDMIPIEIDKIKTDVIEGNYYPLILSLKVKESMITDPNIYRPLQGGISIGPDRTVGGYIFAGTLGCFVRDNNSNETLMLSNFHVICIDNTYHPGDIIDQPSLVDVYNHYNSVGNLNRGILSGDVDAAVANINIGTDVNTAITQIGNLEGTGKAVLGNPVRKRGRTTELTFGFIDGLDSTVNVNYGAALGTRTLTNQISIRPDIAHNAVFSDHGDSGSVIVDENNLAVGLLFAGGDNLLAFANEITSVESELQITILGTYFQTRLLDVVSIFDSENDGVWLMADYDRDGIPDLVFIKTANTPSNKVEVHIASGASKYQTRLLDVASIFVSENDGVWLMADYDRDGIPDLVFIKTANTPSNKVEVHIASGASKYQTRLLDVASIFDSENDGVWLMADYDRDGIPDLVFIKTANTPSNKVEVHIASGASKYQTRLLDVASIFVSENDGVWLMADYDRDGIPDLVFIKTANTPSNKVEVHIASGASKYQTRLLDVASIFNSENDGVWLMSDYDRDGTPDLIFVKTANTPSDKVEVHIVKK